MRILVTGGAGFIGSHLVEKLLAVGHEVAILDDFNDFYDPQIKHANIASFAKDVTIHHVDLRDSASVRNLFHREKFETIAHLAARAGVRPSIQYPQLYYDTNVSGTLHLLDAARVVGVERFIFASSSSVYGPRQRPDLAIHQFTRRIYAGEPIDQFGDGSTRRDYTYIDDVIQGTMAALNYDGPLFNIFNLGESETTRLKDLIAAIESALGKEAKINQLPEQPGDMPLTCANISKAKKLLGYNPTTQLSDGLPRFIDWFLQIKGSPGLGG